MRSRVPLLRLQPQRELRDYCQREGIILQGYASLGGQDTGKKIWNKLLGAAKKEVRDLGPRSLLNAEPVLALAREHSCTPAQVLLRWALQQEVVLIPKSVFRERMEENADIFSFSISPEKVKLMEESMEETVKSNVKDEAEREQLSRLCWRRDPMRMLDFE